MLVVNIATALAVVLSVASAENSRCYLKDLQSTENLAEETPTATNSGRKLNAICKAGYTPNRERPVCRNGTWIENSISICKESNCRIPKVDHGDLLQEYGEEFYFNEMTLQYDRKVVLIKMPVGRIVAPGNSYILSCHDGYVVQGIEKSEITCTAGKWLPEPLCVMNITCPRLITDNSLVVAYTNDVRINSMAIFLCNSNTRLIVEDSAICMPNGQWSNSIPICKSITCPRIIANNSLVVTYTNDVKVNSTAIFHCNPNTILIGENSAFCMPNGEWSNSRPTCKSIQGCELRDISSQLIIEPMKQHYFIGEKVTFSCPSGLELISEVQTVMCFGKTWSNPIPDCV